MNTKLHRGTKPLISLILALMAVLSVFTLSSAANTQLNTSHQAAERSIYFTTSLSDSLVSAKDIERENLLVVASTNQLEHLLEDNDSVEVIYVHPDLVSKMEQELFRNAFNAGIVIAAINTPISAIAETLLITDMEVDDLQLEKSYGRMGIAAVQLIKTESNLEGFAYFSEFFKDFEMIADQIKFNFLDVSDLRNAPPPLDTSQSNTNHANFNVNFPQFFTGSQYWYDCCGGRLYGLTVSSSYDSGGLRFYTGAAWSTFSPHSANTLSVSINNKNDCGGWHTIFSGYYPASNSGSVWTGGYHTLASNQCLNPSQPGIVNARVEGSHFGQKYNPVSGSTVETLSISLP